MVTSPAIQPASGVRPISFQLPPALEAREPPEARGLSRDEVRLLVSHRSDGRIVHARFLDLPSLLEPGDLLVVNDSATLPAALTAVRDDKSLLTLHLSTRLAPDAWVVEPREPALREAEDLELPGGGRALLLTRHQGSSRLWVARLSLPQPVLPYLNRWGRPIRYPYVTGEWPIETYQTVYAKMPGSVEMPSAGRPFSRRVIESLARRGVRMAAITLHTGVASLDDDEPPYEEWFEVSADAAEAIARTRSNGSRLIAVGTTVLRALESAADVSGRVRPARGWTDLVITPERGTRVEYGLLTGFHAPRASHLAMIEAIAGRRYLETAYRAALDKAYLWHEFGDLHLIL